MNKVKATIKQINKFQVTIEGKTWNDFSKCEDWEGMLKFSSPSGELIVDKGESDFEQTFGSFFRVDNQEPKSEFCVVKVSPSLIGHIKAKDEVKS